MSINEYLLNAVMLVYIVGSNLGTRTVNAWRTGAALLLATVLATVFLRDVPTTGQDAVLEVTGAGTGVLLGVLAARLVRLERRSDGSVQATAGVPFAALWTVAVGGRMAFAFGADHWFAAAIAAYSRAHEITGATAWSTAFILMAITMLAARALVTGALSASPTLSWYGSDLRTAIRGSAS